MTTESDENEGRKALLDLLLTNTVALVRTDGPGGRASGFVIPWSGEYRILSARHVLRRGIWAVEARRPDLGIPTEQTLHDIAFENRETLLLRLTLDKASLKATRHDIAWATLDFDRAALAHEPKSRPNSVLPIYHGPLLEEPSRDWPYAFAAGNQDEGHPGARAVRREVASETDMAFAGKGPSYLRFALARPHQGDAYYLGASGAPVADARGVIIGVLSRRGAGNELHVARLATFIAALKKEEKVLGQDGR
jgi:hypothetical protein